MKRKKPHRAKCLNCGHALLARTTPRGFPIGARCDVVLSGEEVPRPDPWPVNHWCEHWFKRERHGARWSLQCERCGRFVKQTMPHLNYMPADYEPAILCRRCRCG